MSFSPEQLAALQGPLNKAHVKQNPKGFDYVEGWHAIAEANRIFGFDGWDRQMIRLEIVGEPYKQGDNYRVGYLAVVRVQVFLGDRVIVRDGTGYGSGIGKDLNDQHEGAIKEAETDAMKRALISFGNPFGLALYDKAKANVEAAPKAPPPPEKDTTDLFMAACTQLEMITNAGIFREVWGRHKDAWKRDLSTTDYAALVAIMKTLSAKFAPTGGAQETDAFRGGGSSVVAGSEGDLQAAEVFR